MKTCNKCGLTWEDDQFPWHKKGKRHYSCKKCYAAYFKAYRTAKPDMFRRNVRRAHIRTYGIEPEDYDTLRAYQKSACAICGDTDKRLGIDHDHSTGEVRGLLCTPCNTAMASVDRGLLEAMRAYKDDPPYRTARASTSTERGQSVD